MASLPTIPGVDVLTDVARSQLHVMQQIPSILTALNTTMTRLADAIQQSNDTMVSVQRVANRMDRVLDELEEPVVMMGPGLRRLAIVLDDPILTAVPDLLRTAQNDLGPQLRQVLEAQRNVQHSAVQVTQNLADATKALAAIPGVSRVSGLLAPRGGRAEAAGGEEAAETAASETEAAEAASEKAPSASAKATGSAKAAPRKRSTTTKKSASTRARASSTAAAAASAASDSSSGAAEEGGAEATAGDEEATPAKPATQESDETTG